MLKIFTVYQGGNSMSSNDFRNEYAAKALSHELQKIDIFSNSWVNKHPFSELGPAMEDILENGIKNGRQEKGTIYVFPTGPIAEGFTNSRYTITVSSIDKHGGVPRGYVEVCAAVLTSVYGDGVRENGDYMVTTSHPPENCTLEFKGTSASTAMVSGIIALALQANKNLSWRDVQHLVVRASHTDGLVEAKYFKTNGAGHYYHAELGFGLLDADYMVELAVNWKNVQQEVNQKEVSKDFKKETKSRDKWIYRSHHTLSKAKVTVECKSKDCVTLVEHVVIELSYRSHNENNLEIALLSPAGTQSILMDVKQSIEHKAKWRLNFKFISVHFWDEQAKGTWTLVLKQNDYIKEDPDEEFGIKKFSLTIHGTNQDMAGNNDINEYGNYSAELDIISKEDDTKEDPENEKRERNIVFAENKPSFTNDSLEELNSVPWTVYIKTLLIILAGLGLSSIPVVVIIIRSGKLRKLRYIWRYFNNCFSRYPR